MAGPYDILILGLVVVGLVLLMPLAIAWSRHQTEWFLSTAQTQRLTRQREMEDMEANCAIRSALNREQVAAAEAKAELAEAQRVIIADRIKRAVEDGDASIGGFVALTGSVKRSPAYRSQ